MNRLRRCSDQPLKLKCNGILPLLWMIALRIVNIRDCLIVILLAKRENQIKWPLYHCKHDSCELCGTFALTHAFKTRAFTVSSKMPEKIANPTKNLHVLFLQSMYCTVCACECIFLIILSHVPFEKSILRFGPWFHCYFAWNFFSFISILDFVRIWMFHVCVCVFFHFIWIWILAQCWIMNKKV